MQTQYVELLGFILDLKAGTFDVPRHRVVVLKQLLVVIITKEFRVSARTLSCVTGSLVSTVYVACNGSRSLAESNVQRHLSSPPLGSANMFVF